MLVYVCNPVFWRLILENCRKFQTTLACVVSSRLSLAKVGPYLKQQQTVKEESKEDYFTTHENHTKLEFGVHK